jgi:hypothetical protein
VKSARRIFIFPFEAFRDEWYRETVESAFWREGQLRILELREEAKKAKGAKFSLKAYHSVVLRSGSIPLTVMARVVGDWEKGEAVD